MRNILLTAVALTITTNAFAGAGHGNIPQNTADFKVDRTIEVIAGDLWFKPDDLPSHLARRSNS